VDVDLMPGNKDPVNTLFPQQAFHPTLLPTSSELSSLHRVTNPYECSVDGVVMLGTDGINVNDQHKYTDPASGRAPIDTMVDMLETSHVSPTAPDTIQSYPFPDRDPFVLVRCSRVSMTPLSMTPLRAVHSQAVAKQSLSARLLSLCVLYRRNRRHTCSSLAARTALRRSCLRVRTEFDRG
jgi:hypothetical protein